MSKTTLERVKKLPTDSILEEGDQWFAVATPWWDEFQACQPAEDAPSVRNEALIDKQFSSTSRKVTVLKPKLEEGADFVFVPEAAWEVISRELGFDWEIRREVIYLRSQQQLQIESYPYTFKLYYWLHDQAEPEELTDDLNRLVVVLGSRVHPMRHLLADVWLAAPDAFRHHFPQFLGGMAASTASPSPHHQATGNSTQTRICYRSVHVADAEFIWTPVDKLVKRRRTSLQMKSRASKRQAFATVNLASDGDDDDDEEEESEAEFDVHGYQLKAMANGLDEIGDIKLGDLRLDDRSETASGATRLHELLVEQRSKLQGQSGDTAQELGWPSRGHELQWRLALARGDELDALDTTNRWFEARVTAARRNKVFVHYRGWDSKWDEWLSRISLRIAPPHSHVAQWREHLKANASVQVGLQVPGLRHAKWRNATVLDVVPSSEHNDTKEDADNGNSRLRVHVQVDKDDFWLPAEDDLLCQRGTHVISKPLAPRERRLLANDETITIEIDEEDDSESEEDPDEVDNDVEDNSNSTDLDPDGGSSPPSRSPVVSYAAVTPTRRTRTEMSPQVKKPVLGPVFNLKDAFDRAPRQVGPHGIRTPTPTRQFRDSVPAEDRNTAHDEFQALWAQVGNELQANWNRLGQGIMAFVTATSGLPNSEEESTGEEKNANCQE